MATCIICGKDINLDFSYYATHEGKLCSSKCHTRYFWNEKINWSYDCRTDENEPVFRCNQSHYLLGAEDYTGNVRGYSGTRRFIYYTYGPFAGKLMTTTNLWAQGEIPEELTNLLPNNAYFVEVTKVPYMIRLGVPVVEFRSHIGGTSVEHLCTEERLVDITDKYRQ